ncbi:sigma-54-dependent Fis family transcriptional regulator [Azoarcus sp. L1K30]|uniref:sigma-54-dependent Fis family transcriptional regulator n=1 Tax=Azoarcus sp. L1K30 TaxID=2820277 RepID=UPI001B845009|nr:sigma-54-dependent Fis family transcriptional regulator [Azoarcus sp. L1K30]MBR0568195.1 sigma-54-dependent Fis family transcriptional regulator [Azoarcus sp. L1K30]
MMQPDQREHISRVLSVVHGEASPDDRIQRSWRRCIEHYDLDPTRPTPAHIIEGTLLREHRDQIEEFLQVARTGMEQLYKRVCDLGYVLLLTDASGVTVDFIGNDRWQGELRRSGLYLGADWSEARAGTCAVGTCIADLSPITCHQVDHFDASHIGLTCNSAPLFDPTGELLGVLDVSALTSPSPRESQHLALQLTMMYAKMVEDANFMRFFRAAFVLRLGAAWPMVDASGEMMLAFDADGIVVGANSVARRGLRAGGDSGLSSELVGSSLDAIFREGSAEVWRIGRSAFGNERTALTTFDHGVFHAQVIAPRVTPTRTTDAAQSVEAFVSAPALDRLAGDDAQMQRLIRQAKRLVDKSVCILLHGETGTGKEVVAKALHESSERCDKPFVAINCAAIPESLIESELFGYTAGAFTGGRSKGMKGLIAQADGGTLFLDEIGDMPIHLQTRLLRVLAEKEVTPLGSDKAQPIRLTVVAASHRDLRKLIAEGLFREDLYYRLCGAILYLPALRTRTDKDYLIRLLAAEEAAEMGCSADIDAAAMALLCSHAWPGNVRQLRNVLRFALAVSDGGQIRVGDLPDELMEPAGSVPALRSTAVNAPPPQASGTAPRWSEREGQWLLEALQRHKWCVTAAAAELGLCRATVYRRMKRHGIVPPNQL